MAFFVCKFRRLSYQLSSWTISTSSFPQWGKFTFSNDVLAATPVVSRAPIFTSLRLKQRFMPIMIWQYEVMIISVLIVTYYKILESDWLSTALISKQTSRSDPRTLLDNCHFIDTWQIQVAPTGFEPTTSAMPVQCSDQLSYEATQLGAGQFVGLMCSRVRTRWMKWNECIFEVWIIHEWVEVILALCWTI